MHYISYITDGMQCTFGTMQCGFHFPKDGSSGQNGQHSEKASTSNADLMKLLQTQKQQRVQLARDPVYHAYNAAEKQRMIKLKKKGWTEPVKPQVPRFLVIYGFLGHECWHQRPVTQQC